MTVVEQAFGVCLIFQVFQRRITESWNSQSGKVPMRITEPNSEVNGPCRDQTLNLGIISNLLSPVIWSLKNSSYSRAYPTPILDTSNKRPSLLSPIQSLNYQLVLGQYWPSHRPKAKAKHCLNHQKLSPYYH